MDVTYIGPGPVLNGYIKAGGEEIRVISGATRGGAALVVRKGGGLEKPADFRGKRIATPQLGNTQDVACRVWLRQNGLQVTQVGGDAQVLPTANPDQLALFQQGKIDAVWTVEPWVSRLEREADGRIFLEQKDEVTTVVAASTTALKEKAAIVKEFVSAHEELTRWIGEHAAEAKELFRSGFKALTRGEISAEIVDHAWPRLHFTPEVTLASFETAVAEAQSVDLLPKDAAGLDRLMVAAPMSIVAEELREIPPTKLDVSHVSKWFREGVVETHALDDVSLQVDEGEFVCLVGASGCGKSTLLNMIAGLDAPDRGTIYVRRTCRSPAPGATAWSCFRSPRSSRG